MLNETTDYANMKSTLILFIYPVVWALLSRQRDCSPKSQVIRELKCNDPTFEQYIKVDKPCNFSCVYRNFCNSSRFQPEVSHCKKNNRSLCRNFSRESLQERGKGFKRNGIPVKILGMGKWKVTWVQGKAKKKGIKNARYMRSVDQERKLQKKKKNGEPKIERNKGNASFTKCFLVQQQRNKSLSL